MKQIAIILLSAIVYFTLLFEIIYSCFPEYDKSEEKLTLQLIEALSISKNPPKIDLRSEISLPEGGVFEGPGVTDDFYFDKSKLGNGTFSIVYTYVDSLGVIHKETIIKEVKLNGHSKQ